MFLIHYTIMAANYEYGDKFLSDSDDLKAVIPEIICLDDDDDICGIVREFTENGRYEFDCGERAIIDIRIQPVPDDDAAVLSRYL